MTRSGVFARVEVRDPAWRSRCHPYAPLLPDARSSSYQTSGLVAAGLDLSPEQDISSHMFGSSIDRTASQDSFGAILAQAVQEAEQERLQQQHEAAAAASAHACQAPQLGAASVQQPGDRAAVVAAVAASLAGQQPSYSDAAHQQRQPSFDASGGGPAAGDAPPQAADGEAEAPAPPLHVCMVSRTTRKQQRAPSRPSLCRRAVLTALPQLAPGTQQQPPLPPHARHLLLDCLLRATLAALSPQLQCTHARQVDGCGADLTGMKPYFRRSKVCPTHQSMPVVLLNGVESRFCQQCTRCHVVDEFDGTKR